jgi:hypothetical protein
MAVIVIWYETTAAARWASLFIGRTFFNDTITVAIWTGFHVRLMRMLAHPSWARGQWASALPPESGNVRCTSVCPLRANSGHFSLAKRMFPSLARINQKSSRSKGKIPDFWKTVTRRGGM